MQHLTYSFLESLLFLSHVVSPFPWHIYYVEIEKKTVYEWWKNQVHNTQVKHWLLSKGGKLVDKIVNFN